MLIVEDELGIAESLRFLLERDHFRVTHAETLAAARHRLAQAPPVELVILDLGLPDGSGEDLLRELRREGGKLPVIVLTSRAEEVDRVVGLELGADDYVTKPFSPRELVARVKAVLRRAQPSRVEDDLVVDLERRRVTYAGAEIELTRTELDLLAALHARPGHVLSREALLDRVWGDVAVVDRTVDVHVKSVRKKLAAAGAPGERLETVRGVGYRWRERA